MKPSGLKPHLKSQLAHFHMNNRRVFVRIDGDVPLNNGTIVDDSRLKNVLPTLEFIKQKHGKIILATHIDRPTTIDPSLSTKLLMPWFQEHGFTVTYTPDLNEALELSRTSSSDIILLENLRFYKEEQTHDSAFAKQLAALADFYVNEAFGASHRNDTSLTLVAKQFGPEERTIGLACEKELKVLMTLKEHATHPFVYILGGAKVQDKMPYLAQLLSHADTMLLCPALVFTFMKAQQKQVGSSLVADNEVSIAQELLNSPAHTKLQFPTDYQVAHKSIRGALSIIPADAFTFNMMGIAIGPKSVKEYIKAIEKAGTIFFNGPMGFIERPETMEATYALLSAMADSKATTIVAGGDSVAAAYHCGAAPKIDHLISGGGAALAVLSNFSLPGLSFVL